MAKGKGGGGNKYARQIKNYEMIGKGEVKSLDQHLKDGPKTPINQKAKEIIAKEKDQ